MASLAQINANRVNAQSSTGPTTPSGIKNSKFNAIRHGLTSREIVIKGEDPAAYDALRAELVAHHKPANETQAMLVDEIAINWWRLTRARRIESKMIEQFGDVEAWSQKPFLNLIRHLKAIERSWKFALTELTRLQKKAAASTSTQQIGFVLSPPKRSAIRDRFIAARALRISSMKLPARAAGIFTAQTPIAPAA